MRRVLLVAATLFIAIAIALYAALPRLSSSETLRRFVIDTVAARADLVLGIGSLHVGRDLRLVVNGLSVALPNREPFATVDRLTLSAPWMRPGAGVYRLGAIGVDGADIRLDDLLASAQPAQRDTQPPGGGRATIEPTTIRVDDLYVQATIAGQSQRVGPLAASLVQGVLDAVPTLRVDATLDPGLPPLHVRGTLSGAFSERPEADLDVSWTNVALSVLSERAELAPGVEVSGSLDTRLRLQAGDETVAAVFAPEATAIRDLVVTTAEGSIKTARATIAGTVSVSAGGDLEGELSLTAEGFAANDTEYRHLAEGVRLQADASLRRSEEGTASCDGKISISAGEALWDRFYVDLARFAPRASGRVESNPSAYRLLDGHLTLRGLADWSGEATLAGDGGRRTSGHLEIVDLGLLLEIAVKEPFKESYPSLAQVTAGGKVSADLDLALDAAGAYTLVGRAKLTAGRLQSREPSFELGEVNLDIPLALGTGALRERSAKGNVAVGDLTITGSRLGRFATPITVGANTLRFESPSSVDLFGGRMTIETLAADRLSTAPRILTALTLAGVDLADLTRSLDLSRLAGTADGHLDPVVYEDGAITTTGELRVNTLGGTIELSDLGVSELFSPVPALGLDVRLRDLSLAELTAAIEAGRVSGILSGDIADLVLVKGQPVSMNARVFTTPKRGVRQTISVKALDQISILGGSESNALSRGIVGLFDQYRYDKMGFSCTLENDRFTLRGIEHSAGKDLLVVGSLLPPTVNVVSHSQVIAFSEMVRRLARIRESGAAATKEPRSK